jgi:preprotein translocase subunit SecE
MNGWIQKAKTFLAETVSETKKASFPAREELISTTVVVLVTSVVFALFLWVADLGINWLMNEVFR